VAIELPSGHLRDDGWGWEGLPQEEAFGFPHAAHTDGGVTGGVSVRRSCKGKPAAKMRVTSTTESIGYVLTLRAAHYLARVSKLWPCR
jgi:hypothetical protein